MKLIIKVVAFTFAIFTSTVGFADRTQHSSLVENNGIAALSSAEMLRRMTHSMRHLNYEGVLVYADGDKWSTIQYRHAFIDDVEYEKLVHLTGNPRLTIRKDNEIRCQGNECLYMPEFGFNGLMSALSRQDKFNSTYEIQINGEARIAGRNAKQLDILPRDQLRYGYRLWLDIDTGLLLRSDLVTQDLTLLERFQFAHLVVNPDASLDDFEISEDAYVLEAPVVNSQMVQPARTFAPALISSWLPSGFELVSNQLDQRSDSSSEQSATFSDGLTAFSVFIDNESDRSGNVFERQWGATAVVVRNLKQDDSNVRVTVIGELPVATLKRINDGIRIR